MGGCCSSYMGSILQSAVVTAKGEIVLHLPSQYHLRIFQRLVVQQPFQFRPLCRGVAILILDGDAVDGNGRAIRKPGFYSVGVHVVAAGKQLVHNRILQVLILMIGHSNQYRQVVVGWVNFRLSLNYCTVSARILHGHTGCAGGFSLQNPTRDAQTIQPKIAMLRHKMAI